MSRTRFILAFLLASTLNPCVAQTATTQERAYLDALDALIQSKVVPGPKGDKGDKGDAVVGPQGPKGDKGDPGSVIALPTCTTPQPAAETRAQACPAGTVGTWAQSRAYAEAAAPTCWSAGEWLPVTAPAGACTVPPVTRAIAAADVFAAIDANLPNSAEIGGAGLECDGPNRGSVKGINDANGLTGSTPDGMRFGKVVDPSDPTKRVLQFAPHKADALTAAAPRCEASWWHTQSGKLRVGTPIWYAFALRTPDGSYDWESVVSQWHQEGNTVNPFFAVALQKDELSFYLRWNTSTAPTQAGNQSRTWRSAGAPIAQWTVIVVQAVIDARPGGAGFLKLWRDGALLADFTGPVGYNVMATKPPWAKFGVYPWGYDGNSNRWTTPETMRVLFKAPTYVADAAGKYTEADLRAYVLAR